jgi:hypothetical protein
MVKRLFSLTLLISLSNASVLDDLKVTTGLEKVEGISEYFNPPPLIKNFNKYGEKSYSDSEYVMPSRNYVIHPVWGAYEPQNLLGYDVGSKFIDNSSYNLTIKNSFSIDTNSAKEYFDIVFTSNPMQFYFTRSSDKGDSQLKPIVLEINYVDSNFKDLNKPRKIEILKHGNFLPNIYNYMSDKKNLKANLKISFEIPNIKKKFFQIYEIDMMKFQGKDLVEKVSLIGDNIKKAQHPDDVKRIKVYLNDLADGITKENYSDVQVFLSLVGNSVLYKDNILRDYVLNSKDIAYTYEKGYMMPFGGGITSPKVDELIESTFQVPNNSNSIFISKWNKMVNSPGFNGGSIISFDVNNKKIDISPKQLFEKNIEKNLADFISTTIENVHPTFIAYKNFLSLVTDEKDPELQYQKMEQFFAKSNNITNISTGADRDRNLNFTYMYMSFNEYAATWGLTASEAHKLFYVDENNQIIWKLKGLQDYLSNKGINEFIDIDKNNKFSKKSLILKNKNTDVLSQLISESTDDNEFKKLVNDKENKFLLNTLSKTKKGKSFERVFIEETCSKNSIYYKDSDCKIKYWDPSRFGVQNIKGKVIESGSRISGIEFHGIDKDLSNYLEKSTTPELPSQQIDYGQLYSGDLGNISNALKDGALINAKRVNNITPIDYYLENSFDENGMIYSKAIYYYLLKNGAEPNINSVDKFISNFKEFERIANNSSSVLGSFFSSKEDEAKQQANKEKLQTYKDFVDFIASGIATSTSVGISGGTNLTRKYEKKKAENYKLTSDDIKDLTDNWDFKNIKLLIENSLIDINQEIYLNHSFYKKGTLLTQSILLGNKESFNYFINSKDIDINKHSLGEDNQTWDNLNISLILNDDNNLYFVKKLIEKGIDINIKTQPAPPLMNAIGYKRYKIAEYLLNKGANVNEIDDKYLTTSLGVAMIQNDYKAVDMLIKYGALASVYNKNKYDLTVFEFDDINQEMKDYVKSFLNK